ncbi:hypothetical protein [Gimesia chilikensis]|uniref:hypothetical protein n=1 Tax=Gimesia chilikensis TaxID=2605989 RepID=UPI003A933DCF
MQQAGLDAVSNFIFASEADAELFCNHYSRLLLETKIYDGEMTAKEVAAICGKEQN